MGCQPGGKWLEVALPVPEINDASAYDKMPGIGGYPKGVHQWWARVALPAARAVLFASVVDDPAAHPEKWPTEEAQNTERERLFGILRRMMSKKLQKALRYIQNMCRKAEYQPELAWTCCDYADLLLQRNGKGDRARARSLLDEPLAISSELGMRLLMERVLSRREILKA